MCTKQPMLLQKIDHITLFVTDMNRAIDFYTNILELPLRFASTNWSEVGGKENGVFIGLHLTNKNNHENYSVENKPDISFSVNNIQFVENQLREKGVKFQRMVTEIAPGKYVANFLDRDGNNLSLHESK